LKPAPFEYDAPGDVEETLDLLAEHGDDAKLIAGGQSLIPLMALRLARPARLIDVGRLAELQQIATNGRLTIGAGVRQRVAERAATVADRCPLMAQALPFVAHAPIRTRGTIGGSVAHADPAAELPAVALVAEAEMLVRRRGGERVVTAAEFFRGFFETALEPDELLVEVRLPAWPARTGSAFHEVARRQGDFALVGAAAIVTLAPDGTIADARLGFTGVAPTPRRVADAEAVLRGRSPSADAFSDAAARVRAVLDPASDLHATAAYRTHVAGVLTAQVLADATQRSGGALG
jgi:carbon-monoxide dehydrogenase medium subunit